MFSQDEKESTSSSIMAGFVATKKETERYASFTE